MLIKSLVYEMNVTATIPSQWCLCSGSIWATFQALFNFCFGEHQRTSSRSGRICLLTGDKMVSVYGAEFICAPNASGSYLSESSRNRKHSFGMQNQEKGRQVKLTRRKCTSALNSEYSSNESDSNRPSSSKNVDYDKKNTLWSKYKEKRTIQRFQSDPTIKESLEKRENKAFWPLWRFKNSAESASRQFTRKIVSLGKRGQFNEVMK